VIKARSVSNPLRAFSIYRIGPPNEVYDYSTGKLIGRVGPRNRFVPLAVGSSRRGINEEK
jgi:hypothetical protein